MQGTPVADIFENISYTTLDIPDKPRWENTKELDRPKSYRDQSLI